jgi:diguanylate cyclase (GGDEF)-like protein
MFTGALERMFALDGISHARVLMLINIDNFKIINDTLGHPVGDQFLRQTSERIVTSVKESGLGGEGLIVARLGGDEFALLCSGKDVVDHSTRLAEHLLETLSKQMTVNGHSLDSSVSIGIAIAPIDGNSGETLLRNASLAVAAAKANGRCCWERFELGMDVVVRERHLLERDLRAALGKHELRLFYQPLIEVDSGELTGYEALIRWENSERGMVMPDNFIPLAEETGLIVPIGEWVIRTAMAAAASWDEPRTVAVNVSPIQMRSPNLLPTIINALAETGLDPARFEIEITEGVLLNDSEANMAVLHKIRALGIRVALDDFGTGYSSLNYLRTFPFDKIKIDRSFVQDLESREDCRAIVSAVIGLARNLGMVTLAEGVEDAAQLEQLRGDGCSMVQGWYFGKAMPLEHYQPECGRSIAASQAA